MNVNSDNKPKTSIGVWIFLSVLLIVVFGIILVIIGNGREASRAKSLSDCLVASENDYNSDLKNNSTSNYKDENGDTIYVGNRTQFDTFEQQKLLRDNNCNQTYGPK